MEAKKNHFGNKVIFTGSETRTQTPVKATDFESVVSTISPTRQVRKLYQKSFFNTSAFGKKSIF